MSEIISITPTLRKAVLAAWNGKCAYCLEATADRVDHIIPRAKGGDDIIENFAAACDRCNARKRDHILADGFLHIVQAQAKGKAAGIKAKLTKVGKTLRAENRVGATFSVMFPACVCQLLLAAPWELQSDGAIMARGHEDDYEPLEHVWETPIMTAYRKMPGGRKLDRYRSGHFYRGHDTEGVTRNIKIWAWPNLLPLLRFALEHNAGEFWVDGWPYEGESSRESRLNLSCRDYEVLKPIPELTRVRPVAISFGFPLFK